MNNRERLAQLIRTHFEPGWTYQNDGLTEGALPLGQETIPDSTLRDSSLLGYLTKTSTSPGSPANGPSTRW